MAQSFIELHFETLTHLFPNVDPDYLESIAIECEHDEMALQIHIDQLLNENSNHPTREDWMNRRKTEQLKSEFSQDSWNIEEFLKKIPDKDPHKYFFKVKPVSQEGFGHASLSLRYLENHFCKSSFLRRLKLNGYSLVKTVNDLEDTCHRHRTFRHAKPGHSHCCGCKSMRDANFNETEENFPTPSRKDVQSFYLEVAYIEHKNEIEDYLSSMAIRKMNKLEQARSMNMLAQCECCFDNEILPDETVSCTRGHLFCEPCVQKYVRVRIGDAASTFPCMSADCAVGEFSLKILQHVLEPREFSGFLRRQQIEEIKRAGIEDDLESCPFCGFFNIVEEGSKVFRCEGDECGRESCRGCKKESHLPFDCDELEKNEDRARKYVEDKLSEALIRECYKCHNKFIKENTGCNHITCPSCHAHMCYVCRKPLNETSIYSHFVGQGGVVEGKKCPLFSNANLLHVEALESVAHAVEKQIRSSNTSVDVSSYVPKRIEGVGSVIGAPEMKDIVLNHTLKAVNLNKK